MSAAPEPCGPPEALSVTQLLAGAGRALAVAGPGECWVTGTLSGWRTSKAYGWGELVEHSADGRTQVARVPIGMPWAVMRQAGQVLSRSGVKLEDGLEVRVFGALEVNGRYAPLRLVVSALDPRTTVGSVVVARSDLLAALEADGSIGRNASTPLGPAPVRVGLVVPASGGAGHEDFVVRLRASGHPWQLRELRVAMEGPGAPEAIARAILRLAAEGSEVVAVVRGGGAAATLAAFDAEPVARAIARCTVPVVVAVGHASDRSVADVVAHTSVPTPTAAAAWLVDRHRAHEATESAKAAADVAARERAETERVRQESLAVAARGERRLAQARMLAVLALVAVLIVILVVIAR
ncbi:MAG TPA: exodeoxyribonuclease VII large subunit [Acidimicrobiales bacterium]|nr:exodeoxyribonuclease VII large subunit [Acidimicrobiales bacterium]